MTGAAGASAPSPERSPRRKFGLRAYLEVMVRQARCPLCGERLGSLDGLHWDHVIPIALGGADDPDNLQAVHRECHDRKTRGLPATTAGSDIHAIAKVRRLRADPPGGEEFRRKLLHREPATDAPKRKKPWPKRKFSKASKTSPGPSRA